MMSFTWPGLLWLLLLVPLVVGAYLLAQRRRQKYALRFASLSLIKEAMGKGPGFRRHVPPILFMVSLAILAFALARPAAVVPLLSKQGLIVLAIDSSGSMRANDVAPSRMEAAKAAARAFIEKKAAGSRIAIVTFAATASIVQPPTDNKDDLVAAIDRLTMQRGTAIGSGLVISLNAILEDYGESPIPFQVGGGGNDTGGYGGGLGGGYSGGYGGEFASPQGQSPAFPALPSPSPPAHPLTSSIIVLMSDGQSNVGPEPLDVVDQASERKVRVYTIGLGDPNGAVLNYFGRSARVSLDEQTLKEVAQRTNATYQRATSDTDLKDIYENLSTSLTVKPEKIELTALFAAAAAVLLLCAAGFSLLWFNRLP